MTGCAKTSCREFASQRLSARSNGVDLTPRRLLAAATR